MSVKNYHLFEQPMGKNEPLHSLVESYYQGFLTQTGRPAENARLVIGAVIIKHKLC